MSRKLESKFDLGPPRVIIFDQLDQPIARFPLSHVEVRWNHLGEIETSFRPEPTMQVANRSGYVGMCLLLTAKGVWAVNIHIPAYIEQDDEISITNITLVQ